MFGVLGSEFKFADYVGRTDHMLERLAPGLEKLSGSIVSDGLDIAKGTQ